MRQIKNHTILKQNAASVINTMTEQQAKAKLIEFANWGAELVTCTHELCSMSESIDEERYGDEILSKLGIHISR